MKKNLTFVIIAVVLLVALIITYVVVTKKFSNKDEVNIDEIFGKTEYLWEEKSADVEYVEYNLENGAYTIRVGEDITLEGYESIIISRFSLTQAVSRIASVPVSKKLDVNKSEFGKYGFNDSKNIITVHMSGGEVHTLVIGNDVGVDNEVYALDKENGMVCTLSADVINEYLKEPSDYRSKVICTLSNVFIREITVHKGTQQIIGIKEGQEPDSYVMTYPYADATVSGQKMYELLSLFSQIDADDVVEENPADISKYGFNNPFTIYIYDSASKHTLKFGDMAPEGGMYIMYGDRPVVYRGSCAVYEEFKDVDPLSYLSPYVHSYDFDKVSGIKVTKDGKSFDMQLVRSDENVTYKINSKSVKAELFAPAYSAWSTLSYGKTSSENPGGTSYCTVVYTFEDGTSKTFAYYDYDKDYCIVKNSYGVNCFVMKSAIDNAFAMAEKSAK